MRSLSSIFPTPYFNLALSFYHYFSVIFILFFQIHSNLVTADVGPLLFYLPYFVSFLFFWGNIFFYCKGQGYSGGT